jgi:hypothetical protein
MALASSSKSSISRPSFSLPSKFNHWAVPYRVIFWILRVSLYNFSIGHGNEIHGGVISGFSVGDFAESADFIVLPTFVSKVGWSLER